MDDSFNARHSAHSRAYCYRVHHSRARSPFERDRALEYPRQLDRDLLQACAHALRGRHDFTRVHADRDRPRALRAHRPAR